MSSQVSAASDVLIGPDYWVEPLSCGVLCKTFDGAQARIVEIKIIAAERVAQFREQAQSRSIPFSIGSYEVRPSRISPTGAVICLSFILGVIALAFAVVTL